MRASLLSQRISAGSLFSSGGGFLGLSNEKKGPASYTIINFSFVASIHNRGATYILTAYETLYPLKPKNPV